MPSHLLCTWPFSGEGNAVILHLSVCFNNALLYVCFKLPWVISVSDLCVQTLFHRVVYTVAQHVMVFISQACWATWKLPVCCWII